MKQTRTSIKIFCPKLNGTAQYSIIIPSHSTAFSLEFQIIRPRLEFGKLVTTAKRKQKQKAKRKRNQVGPTSNSIGRKRKHHNNLTTKQRIKNETEINK